MEKGKYKVELAKFIDNEDKLQKWLNEKASDDKKLVSVTFDSRFREFYVVWEVIDNEQ